MQPKKIESIDDLNLLDIFYRSPTRPQMLSMNEDYYIKNKYNQIIRDSGLLKALKKWMPGGSTWENRIFQWQPFEVVVRDFSLTQGEINTKSLNEPLDTPAVIKQYSDRFSDDHITITFHKGLWTNNYELTHYDSDIINLYSHINGIDYKRAQNKLAKDIIYKKSQKKYFATTTPHNSTQTKETLLLFETPLSILCNSLAHLTNNYKTEEIYEFINTNNKTEGYAYRITINENQYYICCTQWRKNKANELPSWTLSGFSPPYPFYNINRIPLNTASSTVVITEDLDIAFKWQKTAHLLDSTVILSWIGGIDCVEGLDWEAIAQHRIFYFINDDETGWETAHRACDAAIKNGCKSFEFLIGNNLNSKSKLTPRPKSIELLPYEEFKQRAPDTCFIPSPLKPTPTLQPTDYSVSHLLKKQKELPPFILTPLIRRDELLILAAPQKTAKSWASLDLAMTAASGKSMGARVNAPTPHTVIYLDAEMPLAITQKRTETLLSQFEAQDAIQNNLHIISLSALNKRLNILNPEEREWVENQLDSIEKSAVSSAPQEKPSSKLLVIDNLGKLIPASQDCNENSWRSIERWLRKLTKKGFAIILVTHMTKNKKIVRGTNKILDDADTVISLQRPKNWSQPQGNIVEFHFEATRNLHGEETAPFAIKYESTPAFKREICPLDMLENGEFPTVTHEEIQNHNLTPLHREVLTALRTRKALKKSQITEMIPNENKQKIEQLLTDLLKKKLIRRTGTTSDTKYSAC